MVLRVFALVQRRHLHCFTSLARVRSIHRRALDEHLRGFEVVAPGALLPFQGHRGIDASQLAKIVRNDTTSIANRELGSCDARPRVGMSERAPSETKAIFARLTSKAHRTRNQGAFEAHRAIENRVCEEL